MGSAWENVKKGDTFPCLPFCFFVASPEGQGLSDLEVYANSCVVECTFCAPWCAACVQAAATNSAIEVILVDRCILVERIVRANYEGVVAVPSVGGFEIDYALATVAVISVEATVDRVTKAVWSSRSSVAAPARVNPIVVRTKTREEAEIIQEVVISKHATVLWVLIFQTYNTVTVNFLTCVIYFSLSPVPCGV